MYLARHLKLETYRAIKCISKTRSMPSSILSEANILAKLRHPGIPIVYDIEEDEAFYYIIEEYVEGESLEKLLWNTSVSQEYMIQIGIQLCGIVSFLHSQKPFPVLHQDLKPSHIIVCGNQVKLIDFGIASFFTGSGKNYQIYGTMDFAAPEALNGLPVTPSADVYGLGKVLQYLSSYTTEPCSTIFQTIIQKATAYDAADRYETVRLFKEALEQDLKTACPSVSHLTIKNISVFGSKPGIGTTHIAIALASTLTANGYPAVYTERNGNNHLRSMLQEHPAVKEQNGICYYKYFRGIPDYGQGIEPPDSGDAIYVKDFGVYQKDIIELGPENFNLFILSGSPWDLAQTISTGLELSRLGNTAFICNYNNQSSAKKLAGKLGCKVYCFPFDGDAFTCTETKTDLFFHVLSFERGKKKFLNFRKRQP